MTWIRGRRRGSKPRANGDWAVPPATMRIASCSYTVPLALPRRAQPTSRGYTPCGSASVRILYSGT